MEGYIKLHRQITKWEWYDDANTFRLFIHLLLNANHTDGNWRGKAICRGQRFTSISHLAGELNISDKAIRIALEKLVSTKEIKLEGASNGTMITICKYDTYQYNEETRGQAKGQTKGKRGATNNNDNNDEEVNLLDLPIVENVKTWRDSFEVYLKELNISTKELLTDKEWLSEREKFHPNLDIKLTMEKAYTDFWSKEAGWKNKKSSKKTITIDWKATFNNALTQKMNQVYKTKEYGKDTNDHVY